MLDTTLHPAIEKLKAEIDEIGMKVATSYTLADTIREGCSVTEKREGGWVDDMEACSLGAAYIAAKARGFA